MSRRHTKLVMLVMTQIIIVITAAALGYWIYDKVNRPDSPPPVSPPMDSAPAGQKTNSRIEIKDVTWQEPRAVSQTEATAIFNQLKSTYQNQQKNFHLYQVGMINSGEFTGQKIILVEALLDMERVTDRLILSPRGDVTYLYRDNPDQPLNLDYLVWNVNNIRTDYSFVLPALQPPLKLYGPAARQVLATLNTYATAWLFADLKNIKPVFTDPTWGTIYMDSDVASGAFHLRLPDGTTADFAYNPDFVKNGTPQITWIDKTKNTTNYVSVRVGGCGAINLIDVVAPTEVNVEKDLIAAGTTSQGDTVYEFKNTEHALLQEAYQSYKLTATAMATPEKPVVDYAAFVQAHPLFLWIDPFGRLIAFHNTNLMQQAECGKPVIYLYPEKTMAVEVKLEPAGGFSYTEPAYRNGWQVIAEPNGHLTDRADNKVYPYLFWEGRGGLYTKPSTGFVVAQNEVVVFLQEKLSLLGLNSKEIADFIEFWAPRMRTAPYYLVGFHGYTTMNTLAPLKITPHPDTIIRILMDFSPLEKPITVSAPHFITPQRRGFTVVEWGGVLQ